MQSMKIPTMFEVANLAVSEMLMEQQFVNVQDIIVHGMQAYYIIRMIPFICASI